MARRKTAELTLAQMVQPIRRFRDAAKRLFEALEHVRVSAFDSFPRIEGPPLPWATLEHIEKQRVQTAFFSLEAALSGMKAAVLLMSSGEHRELIQAACDLSDWACDQAGEAGWHDASGSVFFRPGSFFVQNMKQADGWLSFVEDVATLQAMPTWQREILQVIDERGPSTQKELATAMGKTTLSSNERQGLSEMVQAGLLNSGRGHESNGYSLTQLGLRMAQLSRQLRDF